jgi:hypothetical protein
MRQILDSSCHRKSNGAVRRSSSKTFSRIPSTSGVLARVVSARIVESGIELRPLLKKSGLIVQQIKDRTARLNAENQRRFVNLAAEVLGDDFSDFTWR